MRVARGRELGIRLWWVGCALLALSGKALSQIWEKPIAPGLSYRMEVDDGTPRIIHAFRPDFALIDLELPGLSCNELARCLRANAAYADMTLLAITGYGRPRDRREAMKAGFDE